MEETTQTEFIFKPATGYNKWAGGDQKKGLDISPQFGGGMFNFQEEIPASQEPLSEEENAPEPNTEIAAAAQGQEDHPVGTNDVVEEGQEQGQEGTDTTTEVPDIDNPAYFIAKQLAADGFLADESITEDIDFGSVYNQYKESLAPKVQQEVLAEVQQTLNSAGITDENIQMLQAIQNGVPVDELYYVDRFRKYSQLDVEQTEREAKIEAIKEWYQIRELSDKEIKRNLEAIDINEEVDAEFQEAQTFFNHTVTEYFEAQKQISLENIKRDKELRQRNQELLDRAIKLGVIGQERLTQGQSKELEQDIYTKSITIDTQRGKIALSPFEAFVAEFNNDLEKQLLLYKIYKFRGKEAEIYKEQAKEEADKDFINAWKKKTAIASSKTSIKKTDTTNQVNQSSQNQKTSTGGFVWTYEN